jgi:putative tryptophan/tyrosine transport system substrate-binding protein
MTSDPTADRRAFIASLVLGALAAPRTVVAQQAATARIGWLAPESRPDVLNPFRQALKELGWIEGRNLAIEQRYAHGDAERYPELAAELVHLNLDILVTDGGAATKAAQKATTTIPIVFVSGNPIAQGFVASLSRPGGNLTGVSILTVDLNVKRIELLKQAVPGLARLAILEDLSTIRLAGNWQAIEAAARQVGIRLTPARGVRKPDDLDGVFALAVKERAGGILVLASAFFSSHAQRIVSLAAKTRLPAIYEHQGFVETGGLMSYGTSPRDTFRRIAGYVDRILKGGKPADLPVEEPTKLVLAINLKTAKTLGLTIPQSLLLRVDQVIQ